MSKGKCGGKEGRGERKVERYEMKRKTRRKGGKR